MSRMHLTRQERLILAGAALRGAASGAYRSAIAWLLGFLAE